ncbi:alpha-(1,6)-fucosyltransferase [Lingula anatina]|uniref:Alpha-(1,6)-fucosyltransferase n=1 Tax=Lingula anatina TaxID=7574 RepID=A0A1S3KHE4_LINAN|nr:alpha-(1,6)-fucosyltransferase [Lingula anatina]|eukprot:XP_013422050.1 alpha-(1,6)-fucosyltransferase [Lingula anatina]
MIKSQCISAENEIKDVQAVSLPIVDSIRPRPDQLPQSIPEDLAPRLTRFHGHPFVWWMGQVVKYLLRYQPELKQDLDNVQAKFGFKNPIVGIHVRRTDKVGTEAAFHSIEEYMFHVDEYYELLSRRQKIEKKRVYLASDDPGVLPEARSKFPNYEFVGDQDIAKSAGLGSRYSDMSLRGIIIDIHFLSMTDFLVCTFSSQVCRLAYEIMQTMHTDASTYFRSLDDVYYYGGQHGHNQIAIYAHSPRPGEIPLEPGDLVGIAGNHWDGYSKGENKRVSKTGLYPSYKVKEKIEIAKFPTYPEADKNT